MERHAIDKRYTPSQAHWKKLKIQSPPPIEDIVNNLLKACDQVQQMHHIRGNLKDALMKMYCEIGTEFMSTQNNSMFGSLRDRKWIAVDLDSQPPVIVTASNIFSKLTQVIPNYAYRILIYIHGCLLQATV